MADIHAIATIVAKPGQEDALRDILLPAARVFRGEDGCTGYSVLQDRKQPTRFMTYESWRDTAALDAHMSSPEMRRVGPKLPDLLAEPFDVVVLDTLQSV